MKQSALQRAQAAARLSREKCAPVGNFTGIAGVARETLIRYGISGKAGVHLDAVFDRQTGEWLTSAAAIERFLLAVAAKGAEVGKG